MYPQVLYLVAFLDNNVDVFKNIPIIDNYYRIAS